MSITRFERWVCDYCGDTLEWPRSVPGQPDGWIGVFTTAPAKAEVNSPRHLACPRCAPAFTPRATP